MCSADILVLLQLNVVCTWICLCAQPLCVCVFQMSCCYFAMAVKSFIKSGTPYIWMHGEMEYMVSIWLRRPLTKGASKAEWQSKLCGCMLHKAHPEGPTSSWNFKQSGVHTAVPLLLENWWDGSFFRSLTYSVYGMQIGQLLFFLWWIPNSSPKTHSLQPISMRNWAKKEHLPSL